MNSKAIIYICYGKKNNEEKKNILLDKVQRFITSFEEKEKDVTIIEILKKDEIPESKYLMPDLNYKYGYDIYKTGKFFLAGYPKDEIYNKERHISSGKIIKIKGTEFSHSLDTRSGSSGAPICLINNLQVIGIHKSGSISKSVNYGTFIGVIIDELEKIYQNNNINLNMTCPNENNYFPIMMVNNNNEINNNNNIMPNTMSNSNIMTNMMNNDNIMLNMMNNNNMMPNIMYNNNMIPYIMNNNNNIMTNMMYNNNLTPNMMTYNIMPNMMYNNNMIPYMMNNNNIMSNMMNNIMNYEDFLKGYQMGVNADNEIENNDGIPKMNIIFNTTRGMVYKLKVNYGTTIDQLLKQYLNKMNKTDFIKSTKIIFLFNAYKLNFGDKTPVEMYFKKCLNSFDPKIVVNDPYNLI